ncbi:YchJ family metal-binding protein [Xanthomonadaceae bacterium JHOS43]|nr:YchJ family metal-binding protein [Xanthomonadaceae bacterium JHOS43]MCX7562130.1 YchJ family metal-binding protein [Xanthomonadaceae bacterium XH05]
MTTPRPSAEPCPCNPALKYADCCGKLHGGEPAGDAEALMRSRYSAYALGNIGYLLATWHPNTRPATLELDQTPGARVRWLGLRVLEHHRDDADHARVRFVARYKVGGQSAQRMQESSRFARDGGHWFYVDGDVD